MNQEDNHSCFMYDIVDETQRSFEKAIMYLGSHKKKKLRTKLPRSSMLANY